MSARSVKVSSFLVIIALFSASWLLVEASVHQYPGEKFGIKGNAFVVHGGSEGIYSSDPTLNDSSPADSFIRYTTFEAFFSFSLHFHILFFICDWRGSGFLLLLRSLSLNLIWFDVNASIGKFGEDLSRKLWETSEVLAWSAFLFGPILFAFSILFFCTLWNRGNKIQFLIDDGNFTV